MCIAGESGLMAQKHQVYQFSGRTATARYWVPSIAMKITLHLSLPAVQVFHTYSRFSAGLADVSLVHSLLSLCPKGTEESAEGKSNMWWVRHKR